MNNPGARVAWCHTCGKSRNMNIHTTSSGQDWPKCCDQFMHLSEPEQPLAPSGRAEGYMLGQQGAQRALDRAEAASPAWGTIALGFLAAYPEDTFMNEDVEAWADGAGCPPPPDKRAWGQVINNAKKKKLIEKAGVATSKVKEHHGAYKTVWRRVVG